MAGIDIGSFFIKLFKTNCNSYPTELDFGYGNPILTTSNIFYTEIPYVYNIVNINNVIGKYNDEYRSNSPIRIRNNRGKVEYNYNEKNDKYISFDEILLSFLKSVKNSIISKSGNNYDNVNIIFSIPIEFEENQKKYIIDISKQLDINIVYFLYEPVAVAMYYCFENKIEQQFTLFVCDFGATHYSFTLLKIDPRKKLYQILKYKKNDKIGGNFFTKKIADYFLTKWENIPNKENNRNNLPKNKYNSVIKSSEMVKTQLSYTPSTDIDCSLFENDDYNYDISLMTEATMNYLFMPEYDIFENDLRQFKIENKNVFKMLKHAIGVGGVIKMNSIKNILENVITECVIKTDDCQACAKGTSIFASNINYQMTEIIEYGRNINIKLNGKLINQIKHRFHSGLYEIYKSFKYKYSPNDVLYVELELNDSEIINTVNVIQYVRSISSHTMDIRYGIKINENEEIEVYFNNYFITSF